MTSFAERLRKTRILRNLSQAALAKACGLSQSAIANYENGSRKGAKDYFSLAQALAVNPTWLATGSGPMEPLPETSPTQPLYLLGESTSPQSQTPWPLPGIPPDEFWALSDEDRAIIVTTIASLMKSLQKKRVNP